MKILSRLSWLCLLFLAACNSSVEDYSSLYERAHDPWVFRSVLDEKPRMVTAALNDELWIAYSAQTGVLYKAWKGNVNFDGAVYTTAHGPQPNSEGDSYIENRMDAPWMVGGEKPGLQYRGHKFEKGQVWFSYELQLKDGQTIKVSERPEYVTNDAGQNGLERTFKVVDNPGGQPITLDMNITSIALLSNIQTDGNWEVKKNENVEAKGLQALDVEGTLTLNASGETTFTTYFTKQPLVENPYTSEKEMAEDLRPLGERLIARNDCKTCHNKKVKTIGPAYVSVAERYRNTEENVAMLTQKVKLGGAGVWGETAMNAHPNLSDSLIRVMVQYIMELDAEEEAQLGETDEENLTNYKAVADIKGLLPGVKVEIYQAKSPLSSVTEIESKGQLVYGGALPEIDIKSSEFQGLVENFGMIFTGYIKAPKEGAYTFRLASDDGSRLYIGDDLVVDHDGFHGASNKEEGVFLEKGLHPIRVEFFQGYGGKSVTLGWKKPDKNLFEVIPFGNYEHKSEDFASRGIKAPPMATAASIPGDKYPLEEVHPSYDLSQARPETFLPKVGGMDFLSDGRLVVSTWDADGGVYILDGVESGDPSQITVKKVAQGLAEPLGLKVVDDEIYILQKQELTKLIDSDGDDMIDEYYTLANSWEVSNNFHEFAFGLVYKDNHFYATLAIGILPGGASRPNQPKDRGKVIKVNRETGKVDFVAHGLRTPNGIGIGTDGEIFVADNQGDWLPSSKILHVRPGAFFGSRAVNPEGVKEMEETPPVMWLPQDEIGNSPSTPIAINDGPYKGQMIHGEVTNGGVKRVFVEEVNGQYQGALFRFIQGLESGVNRMVWGPDGALYIGGVGSTGNWGHTGKLWYGLQRLKYNEQSTFEMLAVRAKSNGLEIEFTEPLAAGLGWNTADYEVGQWWYKPTEQYGGPKMDEEVLTVLSANVSEDRKRVFLELDGLKEKHMQYIRIPYSWVSAEGHELWTMEAWYNMNQIPANQAGAKTQAPEPLAHNTLTAEEEAAGWELLFNGTNFEGWRNYLADTVGSDWKVIDGAMVLMPKKDAEGNDITPNGGDLITAGQYENFELNLEWKIAACGNSGIMYNVVESEENTATYLTGPEMQVLDNVCHPDARFTTHRAGDLYDMIECKYVTVNPAGEWNQVRLIVNNQKVEHWLNGRKVVEYTLQSPEWNEMVANSKFKDWKDFGKASKGHIALQDHDNQVMFRNVKILDLDKAKQLSMN